jgi:hypothetical protein
MINPMPELEYKPTRHNHKTFLRKAKRRSGFQEAYRALAAEYKVATEVLASRGGTAEGNEETLWSSCPQ